MQARLLEAMELRGLLGRFTALSSYMVNGAPDNYRGVGQKNFGSPWNSGTPGALCSARRKLREFSRFVSAELSRRFLRM